MFWVCFGGTGTGSKHFVFCRIEMLLRHVTNVFVASVFSVHKHTSPRLAHHLPPPPPPSLHSRHVGNKLHSFTLPHCLIPFLVHKINSTLHRLQTRYVSIGSNILYGGFNTTLHDLLVEEVLLLLPLLCSHPLSLYLRWFRQSSAAFDCSASDFSTWNPPLSLTLSTYSDLPANIPVTMTTTMTSSAPQLPVVLEV